MTTVAEEKNGASAVTRARENPPSRKSAEHYWVNTPYLFAGATRINANALKQ
jgi:hypothetical protein